MRQRKAFTLIEMMVSMALVLFVMVMLTQAFTAALETFSQLKSVGDMEARLRTVSTVMYRDLGASHFEGNLKLSEIFGNTHNSPPAEGFFRIWQGSTPGPAVALVNNGNPPVPTNESEGTDADTVPSFRSTDHILHFTVKLSGNNRQDFFATSIASDLPGCPLWNYSLDYPPDSHYQSATTYTSPGMEVAYFMRPSGDSTPSITAGGVSTPGRPLYTLYRRQILSIPNNSTLNWPAVPNSNTRSIGLAPNDFSILAKPAYAEVSCKANFDKAQQNPPLIYFNSMTDLTIPERRFGMDPTISGGLPVVQTVPAGNQMNTLSYPTLATDPLMAIANYPPKALNYPNLTNADALLLDVLSFDIKVFNPGTGTFSDLPASSTNLLFTPSMNNPTPPHVFDTWSQRNDQTYDYSGWSKPGTATSVPLQVQIQAIQITIRVWDRKTQRSRQFTFVQNM
jgi:prepilin-type N-terminal cleavage/methylation domain-containing protein